MRTIIINLIFMSVLSIILSACKKIDRTNLIIIPYSFIINKTDDTLIFIKFYYNYLSNYNGIPQVVNPNEKIYFVKGGRGCRYLNIFKKQDTTNVYIKFSPEGPYNYKKDAYNSADWDSTRTYTIIEKKGIQYYEIIVNNYFYLTKDNIINP